MGLFQRITGTVVESGATSTPSTNDRLALLTRITTIRFPSSFRGLDPAAVDRLLRSIAAHEPNLRAGLDYRHAHGHFPTDEQFTNSMAVLRRVNAEDLPIVMRGYDQFEVTRVLSAVNELPTHIERSHID